MLYSMSKLSWPKKKLNNFITKAATHLWFAPWESSCRGDKKYSLSKPQNRREGLIQKLNIKVYGNRKKHSFPFLHSPEFCHGSGLSIVDQPTFENLDLEHSV